ncbi:transcription cofactor vestigial-like protein 4 [Ornithodoros turicata]|uniref:transcription cofactor vestigial-like protein 4 n=1 Tax=Ornithodoros turicata TaxID=34597 RepID=UPI0031395EE2
MENSSLEVLSQAATFVETESAGEKCEAISSPRCFKKRAIANARQDGYCAPPAQKLRRNGNLEPLAHQTQRPASSSDSDDDADQPLDMSNKSRTIPEARQQLRPSVITCAFRTQCHVKDVADTSDSSEERVSSTPEESHLPPDESSMCDPVIDEHFRRSLGKDYAELFTPNTSSSVSVTVDDHFAKALGDTWVHLQKQTTKPGEESGDRGSDSGDRASSLARCRLVMEVSSPEGLTA